MSVVKVVLHLNNSLFFSILDRKITNVNNSAKPALFFANLTSFLQRTLLFFLYNYANFATQIGGSRKSFLRE